MYRFIAFPHFLWPYIGYLPCRDKNSFGPTHFMICDQILNFNLCKTFNFYAHFSAERWEYKLKVNQILLIVTKFSPLANVNALHTALSKHML